MEFLYLGSFFPEHLKDRILSDSKGVVQNAGDTFQKALLSGLIQHRSCQAIITSPMIGSFPKRYKKIIFNRSTFEYKGIQNCVVSGFNNITLYKNISKYKSVKQDLISWLEGSSDRKYILVFSLDLPLLRAVYEVKKKYCNIHVCLIITDLIEYMVVPKTIGSKFIMNYFNNRTREYLKKIDSYVLLTKYMKEKLGIEQKPYTVIEAIYNQENKKETNIEKEKCKTILYTGTLAKVYGIVHLLNSFSMIKYDDYRLWICGDGDAKEEIEKRQAVDNRIKYWGQIPRDEVLSLQRRATVVINPRLSDSEFTKYSFASKTVEYLASGTPLIMHPLLCLTDDYLKHIYIAHDETDVGLKNKIIEVCDKTKKELSEFGSSASDFVLSQKNAYVQVSKILEMIRNEK